jgi:hypothetical protein
MQTAGRRLDVDDAAGWIVVTFTILSTQERHAYWSVALSPAASPGPCSIHTAFSIEQVNADVCAIVSHEACSVTLCHPRCAVQLHMEQESTPLQPTIAPRSSSNSLGSRVVPIQFRAGSTTARLLQQTKRGQSRARCKRSSTIIPRRYQKVSRKVAGSLIRQFVTERALPQQDIGTRFRSHCTPWLIQERRLW